jgi:YD repeat-containing protein
MVFLYVMILYRNGSITTKNTYSYDTNGQIIQKNVFGSSYLNSSLKMQYDDAGRPESLGEGVAEGNYFYSNYKYTNDRLTKVQTDGLQTYNMSEGANATYEYYPDGKLKKITYPKLNDNSLLTTEYVYNALGRLSSMTNNKGSSVLSQFSYTYDANGNIVTVKDSQTTTSYIYDKLNRLKGVYPQTGDIEIYSYDLHGNRLMEIGNNYLDDIVDTSYYYDLDNNLKKSLREQQKLAWNTMLTDLERRKRLMLLPRLHLMYIIYQGN